MTKKQAPSLAESAPHRKKGDFTEKALRETIGGNLRDMYDAVVNEDVPDDFLALLAQADDND